MTTNPNPTFTFRTDLGVVTFREIYGTTILRGYRETMNGTARFDIVPAFAPKRNGIDWTSAFRILAPRFGVETTERILRSALVGA